MDIKSIEKIAKQVIADQEDSKKRYNEWEIKCFGETDETLEFSHRRWVKGVEALLEQIIKEEDYQ